jgi:diketogulonate reductase-like aldo/keto reductase
MEYKELNEEKMPVLGLGTWQLQGEECVDAIKYALDAGYTHIDTADMYKNHDAIKNALQNTDRDALFITTKLWPDDIEVPVDKVKDFLRELGVDYLDLVLLHWPKTGAPMVEALKEVKQMSEVKHVGVSNCTIHHLKDMIDAGFVPEVNQVEFHPYLYQQKLLDFCKKQGIVLTAYSPLARGELYEDPVLIDIGNQFAARLASQQFLGASEDFNLVGKNKGRAR